MASQHLTKSRYIAGLQCPRRLWLVVHEPLPYEDPAPGSPMDIGQEIGTKAHLLFPGGVLITEEPWQHAEAVAHTAALMDDARVPAIFEAAFEYDGIRIRVDVMERLASGAWGLREVKSSSGLKDHYLDDIALQALRAPGRGHRGFLDRASACEYRLCAGSQTASAGRISSPAWMSATLSPSGLSICPPIFRRMRDCLAMTELPDVEPGKPMRDTLRVRVPGPLHGGQARRLDQLSAAT